MEIVDRIIFISFLILVITIIVSVWLWYREPYSLINWWNHRIKSECDLQDEFSLNGIPSYHDAWECRNKSALELHRLISVNHDDILAEVLETMKIYDGIAPGSIGNNRYSWVKTEEKWRPIWIRYMGEWAGSADRIPTLKRILSAFPDVPVAYVSIFYPGTTLIEHTGPSRSVYRYHYGLKIPDGDIGLKLAGFDIKWKEREGFIWDDTLPHSAWNHTLEARIVIFADIFRELSPLNSIGSKLIYNIMQGTRQVTDTKYRLKQDAIVVD